MVSLTEVAEIESMLSLRSEGAKACHPFCSLFLDCRVMRVETAGPFPAGKGVRQVNLGGHVDVSMSVSVNAELLIDVLDPTGLNTPSDG